MSSDLQQYLRVLSLFVRVLPSSDKHMTLRCLIDGLMVVLNLICASAFLATNGRLRFITGAPVEVAALERAQYEHEAGPCVSAHRSGETVAVADLRQEVERWPLFCVAAERIGVRSAAAIPLRQGNETIGVVVLYRATPGQWSPEDLAAARIMVDVAALHVVNSARLRELQTLAEQLQKGLKSRVVIEQAKGVLSNHCRISVDDAFQRIRRHARNHNASIHKVAEAIVSAGLRPSLSDEFGTRGSRSRRSRRAG